MNPVRVALANALKEDAGLKKLATGVHHRKAPKGSVLPYVVFHKASGVPTWSFGGPPIDRDVWLVKGVGTRDDAEAIDERCKAVLNGASLDIEGKAHQDLRHISDVDYDEEIKGERIDHVGAEYKLDSEKE